VPEPPKAGLFGPRASADGPSENPTVEASAQAQDELSKSSAGTKQPESVVSAPKVEKPVDNGSQPPVGNQGQPDVATQPKKPSGFFSSGAAPKNGADDAKPPDEEPPEIE
jgi:hypothetical protein